MSVAFCNQRDSVRCKDGCARVPSSWTSVHLPAPDSRIVSPVLQENNLSFLLRLPIRAGLIFAIVSMVWLLLTAFALDSNSASAAHHSLMGLAYTLLGTALVYWLLKRSLQRTVTEQLYAQRNAERLAIALTATKSGVWEWHFPTRRFHLSPQLMQLLGEGGDVPSTWGDLLDRIHPEDQPLFGNVICTTLQRPDEEHTTQYRVRQPDGGYAWFEVRGRLLLNSKGQPQRVVGVAMDITNTKEKDSHIERLTYFDPLTGLPNRARFMHMLDGKMEQRRTSDSFLLVARIDINRFQDVNNVFGAAVGDTVLTLFGHRLEGACGRRGLVSRFAGDDFAIAVSSLASAEAAQALAGEISQAANLPIELDGESLSISAIMGAAIGPNDGDVAETLVSYAELALVRAREEGQLLGFYEEGMNEAFRERAYMEQELAVALRDGEGLTLAYQPIVQASDGALVGFEALARWTHPVMGTVSPAVFVPLAEACGLIGNLGSFVLRTACAQAARWRDDRAHPVVVAINVSARQMDDDSFVEEVATVLAQTGLPAHCLELEVTESVIMNDCEAVSGRLGRLRDLGVLVAVDDFGTGYSSLAVLRQLPVNKLKIDRCFVQDLNTSEEGDAIVAAILELAQSMNLTVTAEGVETPEQLAFLRERQCQTVQGYLISRPLAAEALGPFLANTTADA